MDKLEKTLFDLIRQNFIVKNEENIEQRLKAFSTETNDINKKKFY